MTEKINRKQPKSKVSVSKLLIVIVFPLVTLIFGFLFLQTEIKFLYKEIYQKEKQLEIVQNQLETNLVEVQKLSAEGRIVEIAKMRLGMVRINNTVENIFVNQLRIEQIKNIVDSKYE
ncbi:MAG: cell division protein FtsL [Bacteroidetes bacterium]|nr:cell division protein FtsL [Bacteroidota bacterium]MBU1116561.1 cell division protein FtsL [Bacteroidota bacterium]MBU1797549.1 cell division protein FtsL [Bacteroidota bacterium]